MVHVSSLTIPGIRNRIRASMRRLFIVTALFLAVPSFACKCAQPSPNLDTPLAVAEWRISQSPVIFEGRAEKIEFQGWPIKPQPGRTVQVKSNIRVTFSGARIYRGDARNEFAVETGLGLGDCGYHFEQGQSYLVYAWIEDSGSLSTGICSGTTPLDYAGAALRLLRGEPPTPRDVVRRFEEENSPASDKAVVDHELCGKVSFPKGKSGKPLTIYFWLASPDAAALPSENVNSDEDGSFCATLDPGTYLIEAVEDPGNRKERYAGYFPGVKDRTNAQAVVLKEAGGAERADFAVVRRPLYRVRGYVRGVKEAENDHMEVMVMPPTADPFFIVEPVHLAPHGFFEILGLPPGKYSVFAIRDNETDDTLTFVSEVAHIDLQDNVEGLKLQFVPAK
jgi:hypothetical protein